MSRGTKGEEENTCLWGWLAVLPQTQLELSRIQWPEASKMPTLSNMITLWAYEYLYYL